MQSFWRLVHCTWAFLLIAASAAAQQTAPKPTSYTTFVRGTPVGREDVTVRSEGSGMIVTSEGRVSAPVNLTIERAEFRYGADGSPQLFELKAAINGVDASLRTTVSGGNATTETAPAGSISRPISPQAILHYNGAIASYVVLAERLGSTAPGSQLRMFLVPQADVAVRIVDVQNDRLQLGNEFLNARRYNVIFETPGSDVAAAVTTDVEGALLSVRIPSQSVDIARSDVSSSMTRTQVHSNPGDEPVTIPATGFNLGATLTRPRTTPAGGRFPAVILLGGAAAHDRDGFLAGIPTIGQIAGALAEAGFLALRYDKRGYGQSGGRSESATINDSAEDARLLMRWLANRKDVDPRRIALVGHGEGAWVALLAASTERRIAAIVTIASPSNTGAELILEQQQRSLESSTLSPEERAKQIALQKQVNAAVQSGKGLTELPGDVRKQADTPWFQSLLKFTPARVLRDIRQPLLIVHGALDREVPVDHADRLAAIAQKESDSKSVEVIVVKGVNHLLAPAVTGEVREYGTLPDRTVSKDVTAPIAAWLTRTFAAIK